MDAFYLIVLSIVIVLLILILTYIGIKMTSAASGKVSYPPVSASCPDYWNTVSTDPSSCLIPTNASNNVGSMYDKSGKFLLNSSTTYGLDTNAMSINFANKGWNVGGLSSLCGQKSWANQYGIQWDGVSNYNSC